MAEQEPTLMLTGIRLVADGTGVWAMVLRISSARANAKAGLQLFQDHQELLTTEAADKIIRSHGGNQPFGRFPQDIISGEVAVSIMTLLK